MREIKFRVWYEKPELERDGKSQYVPKGAFVHSVCVEKPIADDVYTYEQFTGLHDKNGKEIYEGDILGGYPHGTAAVEWSDEWACFQSYNYEDHEKQSFMLANELNDCKDEWKIIGNIHENPDLLK